MKQLWDDERIDAWITKQQMIAGQRIDQQRGLVLGQAQWYNIPQYPKWEDVVYAMKMVRDEYEANLHTIAQKLDKILQQVEKLSST